MNDVDKSGIREIYIAGPMRGIPYFNFPAFDAACRYLAFLYPLAKIVSPADMDREAGFNAMDLPATWDWNELPAGFALADAVQRDLAAVMRADAIYLLHGYRQSSGAMAELAVANWMNKAVWYENVTSFPLHPNTPAPAPAEAKPVVEASPLPQDAAARKRIPLYRGLVRYFPDALAEVAKVSFEGNEQHHPGTELHWDKSKSTDEPDALLRHLWEGEHDMKARAQVAWRALAWLQRGLDRRRQDEQ
jgi:hypothetical protein